jgi:hypothetical protein
MFARRAGLVAASYAALTIGISAQAQPDVDTLLARVAERIEVYYKRAQNIMCVEKTTVLPLGQRFESAGLHRVTEAELRVEAEVPADRPSFVSC